MVPPSSWEVFTYLPVAKPANHAFLDIDKPTPKALTKLIAKFTGVSTRKELGELRRAHAILGSAGFAFSRSADFVFVRRSCS